MSVYLDGSSVLLDSGSVAIDTACCCGGVCCDCDGMCDGSTNQTDCEEAGNQWIPGASCSDDPCGTIATGACCNDTTCTIKTELCCGNGGGIYQGDGTPCDPNPCTTPPPCNCGFGGFLGMGTYLTKTTTFTYSDTRGDPFEPCDTSWTYVTVDTYDPISCIITESCSGSGHQDTTSGGHEDSFSWNWILTFLGTCGCGPTTPEGFVCNTCSADNPCSTCGSYSVINDTEETSTCSFSDTGFSSSNTCTVVLSNPCTPI